MSKKSIKLQRVRLDPSVLEKVPKDERDLFFALGLFANDLSVLQRLIVWTGDLPNPDSEPTTQASQTQSFILLRLMAGKQVEAWKLLEKNYCKATFRKGYEEAMETVSLESFATIESSHSEYSSFKKIRDKFAFHFDARAIGGGFSHLGTDTLDVYLGKTANNALFHCSEVVVGRALSKSGAEEEQEQNLSEAVSFVPFAKDWANFVFGFFEVFLRRHPGLRMSSEEVLTEAEPPDRPPIGWFIEDNETA